MAFNLPNNMGGAYRPNMNIDDPNGDLNNVRMGGGLMTRPTPQDADLQKQRNSMNFMNNAASNLGIGQPGSMAVPAAAPSSGSFLENMMAALTGGQFGGSSNTSVASGDTNVQEQKGDTLGSFTSFINNLLQTAMSGKVAADSNATRLGSERLGANTQAALASQVAKKSGFDKGWVGDTFAAMRPGFRPATVAAAPEVDTSGFMAGVPDEQIYGGGLGGADPTGILGIPSKPRPSSSQVQQQSVPQGQYGDPEPYYRRPDGVATRNYNPRSHMNRGANRPMSDYIPQSAYSDYAQRQLHD